MVHLFGQLSIFWGMITCPEIWLQYMNENDLRAILLKFRRPWKTSSEGHVTCRLNRITINSTRSSLKRPRKGGRRSCDVRFQRALRSLMWRECFYLRGTTSFIFFEKATRWENIMGVKKPKCRWIWPFVLSGVCCHYSMCIPQNVLPALVNWPPLGTPLLLKLFKTAARIFLSIRKLVISFPLLLLQAKFELRPIYPFWYIFLLCFFVQSWCELLSIFWCNLRICLSLTVLYKLISARTGSNGVQRLFLMVSNISLQINLSSSWILDHDSFPYAIDPIIICTCSSVWPHIIAIGNP